MLFNSVVFIVLFLPLCLLFYYYTAKISSKHAIAWLVFASLIFYGWHEPKNLLLIGFSLTVNYLILSFIEAQEGKKRRVGVIGGIVFNLLILSYYKYTNFFIDNLNHIFQSNLSFKQIVLPLAISFFTFQKIAFLVDVYRKQAQVPSFLQYSVFVLFFPQLIAGPILRHGDFLPQLNDPSAFRPIPANLAIGLTIFIIGLFKKTVFADGFMMISDPVFSLVQEGITPNFVEAWIGVLAFSMQIYFDFSGYSDMAVGLARLFNFKFPMNFNSPYKATSIIDFWRRWHISLSFFLRDYLYIPLGGNRLGVFRRYLNLFAVMLIGGLWHGASWTFVIWGGLNGLYLSINHLLRKIFPLGLRAAIPLLIKRTSTFFIVTLTWVFFRAESFKGAAVFFKALFGLDGFSFSVQPDSLKSRLTDSVFVCMGLSICFFLPNVYEWIIRYRPVLNSRDLWESTSLIRRRRLLWRPTWYFLLFTMMIFFIAFGNIEHVREFIYFQF